MCTRVYIRPNVCTYTIVPIAVLFECTWLRYDIFVKNRDLQTINTESFRPIRTAFDIPLASIARKSKTFVVFVDVLQYRTGVPSTHRRNCGGGHDNGLQCDHAPGD